MSRNRLAPFDVRRADDQNGSTFDALGDYIIAFRAKDAHYALSHPTRVRLTQDQPPNRLNLFNRDADQSGLDWSLGQLGAPWAERSSALR